MKRLQPLDLPGILLAAAKTRLVRPSRLERCFGHLSDRAWLWANTAGANRYGWLRSCLPPLPDIETQRRTNGVTGDLVMERGFRVYQAIRRHCAEVGRPLRRSMRILDFGCGWGRILRLFLRDMPPSELYGVDTHAGRVDFCRATLPGVAVSLTEPLPPLDFPDGYFDLIYLNSVFSHLSEDCHRAWLGEFHRLLVPGGVLAATTWPRDFIERCDRARRQPAVADTSIIPLATYFLRDKSAWLARYDAGGYCFSSDGRQLGKAAAPWQQYYGATCIPEAYVREHWAPAFRLHAFTDHDRNGLGQNMVVATTQ